MQSTRKLFKSKEAESRFGIKDKDSDLKTRPKLKNLKVFVQSQGIGRRPLFGGTTLLYDPKVSNINHHLSYNYTYNVENYSTA